MMAEKKVVVFEVDSGSWGIIVDGVRGVWREYRNTSVCLDLDDTRSYEERNPYFRDTMRMDSWSRKAQTLTNTGGSPTTLRACAFAEAGVEPDEVKELERTVPPAPGTSVAVRNNRHSGLVFDGKTGELSRFGAKEEEAYYAALRSIETRDSVPVQAWTCEETNIDAVLAMLRTYGPALGPVIRPDTRRQ